MRELQPCKIEELEQYAGYVFSWSGDRFRPVTKTRRVARQLYNPVPLDVLVEEMRRNEE
jgi:hypothetical protein